MFFLLIFEVTFVFPIIHDIFFHVSDSSIHLAQLHSSQTHKIKISFTFNFRYAQQPFNRSRSNGSQLYWLWEVFRQPRIVSIHLIRIIVFEFIRRYALTNPHTFSLYWGSGSSTSSRRRIHSGRITWHFPSSKRFSIDFFVRLGSKCVRIECVDKKANSQREDVRKLCESKMWLCELGVNFHDYTKYETVRYAKAA